MNAPPQTDLSPAGGRPTKYEPRFCGEIIAHCEAGRSFSSFAAHIRVARRTLWNWVENYPEFADAFDIAKCLACAKWEERAGKVGDGEGGPGAAAMCQFMLKNFGGEDFTDRREVAYSGAVNHNLLTYEQAIEEARRLGLPERVLLPEPAVTDPDE